MTNHEHTNPILDERTIPNHGRSLDDFEPETRTLTQIYIPDRKRRNSKLEGMIEPYKQEEIDRAAVYLSEIYHNLIQKFASAPDLLRISSGIWLLRRLSHVEGQEMNTNITFIGGMHPNEAHKIHVNVVNNLNSYLVVNSKGGETRETVSVEDKGSENRELTKSGKHIEIAYPGTMIDVRYYRRIINSL